VQHDGTLIGQPFEDQQSPFGVASSVERPLGQVRHRISPPSGQT
jgi:hypothetical protein